MHLALKTSVTTWRLPKVRRALKAKQQTESEYRIWNPVKGSRPPTIVRLT